MKPEVYYGNDQHKFRKRKLTDILFMSVSFEVLLHQFPICLFQSQRFPNVPKDQRYTWRKPGLAGQ